MPSIQYNNSVFINCPFDKEYEEIFNAVIFTVYACGFYPKTALDDDDATDNRLDKIIRKIKGCKYGVHDLSRIELNKQGFPRFNMPFELGLFFGAKKFGEKNQKTKVALIFEKVKYNYQKYISDINGMDTKAHENDVSKAMKYIRDWLATASKRTNIPSSKTIIADYAQFCALLPQIALTSNFHHNQIPYLDYCTIVEEYHLQTKSNP